jgi:hypothetical protein
MDKNLKGSYNFKEVGVGGRIILKLALRKSCDRVCVISARRGTRGERCEHCNKPLDCTHVEW